MNITVIHVGGLKEKYYAEAVAEYEKRISGFCRIRNAEIKEERLPEQPTDGQIAAALAAEGKRILAQIPPRSFVTALCVEGERLGSEELAQTIASAAKDVVFIIGSSYGLSPEVKRAADLRLSVSAMTFPHRLMRVILAEQIYRALSINAGRNYHK